MTGLRLVPGKSVRVMYRVDHDSKGAVRSVWRIVWQGDPTGWIAGDGFFAHDGTGWQWTPEDFSVTRGMAWEVSGMGGADDDSEPMSREDALAVLAERGAGPDSLDYGLYSTEEEKEAFAQRRRALLEWVVSRLEAEKQLTHSSTDLEELDSPGEFQGRHYATYVDEVKQLKRRGELDRAEDLLLPLLDAVEAEARAQDCGVAPWYYEQLAIVRRKKGDLQGELNALERYERQKKAPGTYPEKLRERLAKVRRKLIDAVEPRHWSRDEWIARLQEHARKARVEAPIADRRSLSLEDEYRCRINGGSLIAWLNRHGPEFLLQRRFFRGSEDHPVLIFTTDAAGLVATQEVVGEEPSELIYLFDAEYEEWISRNNDDLVHHVHLWAKFTEPDDEFLERARREYPQPIGWRYWKHSEGTIWGHLAGRGVEHLWTWNGRESTLLKEAFTEWVS